ncbi:hypothetical protein SELMODRAFT_419561 [Selaginella moellendorffii]|uniref:Dirigent protein n=1 Tax=Selaginella moellendorffii TaxID=88036 RepID=D8S9B8_SELML|nr:dirigent protein 2 [Selaginella moellendorffii]EFJ18787.1 hypothetical protein SELMODRAFT_419561 [Selaginella moellendorffii]|eukprot:XP_002979917.1 dirigent protein 2 [Selaginella moellendorffii]
MELSHIVFFLSFFFVGSLLAVEITAREESLVHLPDNFNRDRTIEFYQHIIRANGSTSTLSETPIGGGTPGRFGYAVVFDHKLTQGSDYFSQEVGRVRGAAVVSSLDGSQAHETFTVSLAGRNGALSCAGSFELRQPVTRVPIVGGTGEFYRMEGVYTSQVVHTSGANVIARVQLTIRRD